jgi:hypothetical protein
MTDLIIDQIYPAPLLVETPDDDIQILLSAAEQGPPGSQELKVHEVVSTDITEIDYAKGEWQVLSLQTDISQLNVVNWPPAGKAARLVLEINNTGGFSIEAWPANTRWVDGPPAITLGAGKDDLIVLSTGNGGAKIFGSVVGQDFTP